LVMKLNSSTEQSPSLGAYNHSASQIPHLLWTQRFITIFIRACH
jgi:hypothetical protein